MGLNLFLFAKQLTVLSALLFVAHALIAFVLPDRFSSKAFWSIVPFFYTVVLLSRVLLKKLSSNNKKKFSIFYVRINVFRFFIYFAVMIIYAFSFPDDAIAFIITFFVFYFIYTIFEISSLYKEMKSP